MNHEKKFNYGTSDFYSKCKLDDEQKQMHLIDWIRINREMEKLHVSVEALAKKDIIKKIVDGKENRHQKEGSFL